MSSSLRKQNKKPDILENVKNDTDWFEVIVDQNTDDEISFSVKNFLDFKVRKNDQYHLRDNDLLTSSRSKQTPIAKQKLGSSRNR